MKKIFLALVCATALFSCQNSGNNNQDNNEQTDSTAILKQQLAEQEQVLAAMNEIESRLAAINEAEGRIRQLREAGAGVDTQQNIQDEISFIEETLAENHKKIEELQEQLNKSNSASTELKNKLKNLTKQLEQRDQEIKKLTEQISQKDARIGELDESVNQLTNENERVKEENARVKEESETNAEIARNQDAQLNTAWYIYGTSKELKAKHILDSGEVLKNGDFDKNDFIKIDIRKTNVIPLDAKHAKLLSTHPEGSYNLLKDANGLYILHITDAYKFWSVSKFLVVRVR